ncbi:MAG: hypothetical protein AAF664_14340 [Planctomycetota bacterium]
MNVDRRQFGGLLVSTLFTRLGWDDPSKLPSCPPHFTWTRSSALEAFVPCPAGWHFHEVDNDGQSSRSAYFTREDYAKLDQFSTGFVVNVVRGMDGDIATWCNAIVNICLEGCTPIEHVEDSNDEYFTYGIEKVDPPKGSRKTATRIRLVSVGNKHSNTLYLVQFEAPANQWESAWEIGRRIYDMFKINPDV